MTSVARHVKSGNSFQEKVKTVRRHGACNPCKISKTKCDGAEPCSACRSEKRKSRTCEYSDKARGIAAARQQIETERIAAQSGNTTNKGPLSGNDSIGQHLQSPSLGDGFQSEKSSMEAYFMCRPISLCEIMDEFIEIKPPKGQAAQAIQKSANLKFDGGITTRSTTHEEILNRVRDCSIENTGSDDHQSPSSTGHSMISRKLNLLKDIVSEGYISEVWVELGKLAREAQILSTAQHNAFAADDNEQRQAWFDMIELDCFLSFTLGYPSSLSRWQKSRLFSGLLHDGFENHQYHDTWLNIIQTIQKVLDFDMSCSEGILNYLHFARRFIKIEDTDKPTPVEKIATCTTEKDPLIAHELKIMANLLLMVIFCRTASICNFYSQDGNIQKLSDEPDFDIIKTMELHIPRTKSALCRMVIKYAKFLLDAFTYLCQNDVENTAKNWMRCYSAMIAAIMIGIAKVREKNTDVQKTSENLEKIENLFRTLADRNSDNTLLSNAAMRIRELNIVKSSTHGSTDSFSSIPALRRKSPSLSTQSSPTTAKQSFRFDQELWSTTISRKRSIEQVEGVTSRPASRDKIAFVPSPTELNLHPPMVLPQQYLATCMELTSTDPNSIFSEDGSGYHHSMEYNQPSSLTPSVNSSFAESDGSMLAMTELPLGHPGPPFVFPWDYTLLHPPMVWNAGYTQETFSTALQQSTSAFAFDSSPLITHNQVGTNTHVEDTVRLNPIPTVINHSSPSSETNPPDESTNYTDTVSVNTSMNLSETNSFFNMTAKSFEEQQSTRISNPTDGRETNIIPQTIVTGREQSVQEKVSGIPIHESQRRCSVDMINHYHMNDSFTGYDNVQGGNLHLGSGYSLNSQDSRPLERSDFETMRASQWRRMSIDTGSNYL